MARGRPPKYTPEMILFLCGNAHGLTPDELTHLFNRHFSMSCTVACIKALMYKNGITTGLRAANYTPDQILFLRNNAKAHTLDQLIKLFNDFYGIERTKAQIKSLLDLNRIRIGVRRYGPIGKPIGHKTESGNCVFIKSKEGWKNSERRQRAVWKRAYGPVPENCSVIFLDGDHYNFDLGNLAIITNSEKASMARNGYFFSDAEFTKTGLAIARHRTAITSLVKKRKEMKERL